VYSLTSSSTFKLPSKAKSILYVSSVGELKHVIHSLQGSPYLVLGDGSNTIFLEDYEGSILKIGLKGIISKETSNHFKLEVGAGENWHQFVSWCVNNKIYGLENLALIPGTVGAAPIQNIGAYGVEIEKYIETVNYLDLSDMQTKTMNNKACLFSYRSSIFKSELAGKAIISQVVFSLPKKWVGNRHYGELAGLTNPSPKDVYDKVIDIRRSKLPDPEKIGNAGSFFKNPILDLHHYMQLKLTWPTIPSYPVDVKRVKVPAAWMIDMLGFKGTAIGGISCHFNQPLVLTNDGSGTGEQLLQLARAIKSAVQNEFSIVLENEVRLIGKNGPVVL